MSTPTVTMCPCGTRFRHQKTTWASEFPLSELDGWIAFYRKFSKKRPQNYSADLKALTLFKTLEVSK